MSEKHFSDPPFSHTETSEKWRHRRQFYIDCPRGKTVIKVGLFLYQIPVLLYFLHLCQNVSSLYLLWELTRWKRCNGRFPHHELNQLSQAKRSKLFCVVFSMFLIQRGNNIFCLPFYQNSQAHCNLSIAL